MLYPATLLKVFIWWKNSLVKFWGSLMYAIISSIKKETLISSFQICISMIFVDFLIALVNATSINLSMYGEREHLFLVLAFSGIALNFSHLC